MLFYFACARYRPAITGLTGVTSLKHSLIDQNWYNLMEVTGRCGELLNQQIDTFALCLNVYGSSRQQHRNERNLPY